MPSKLFNAGTLLVLLLAASCAPVSRTLPEDLTPGPKRVVLVTAAADEAHIMQMGLVVFFNDDRKVPVPEWRLGEAIASSAREYLAERHPEMTIVEARSGFTGADGLDLSRSTQTGEPAAGRIADFIRSRDADLAIVVRTAGARLPNTNLSLVGRAADHFGVFLHARGIFNRISPFIAFSVSVVDVGTLKALAQNHMQESYYEERGFSAVGRLSEVTERYQPSDQWFSGSADSPQFETLKADLLGMIREGVPKALAKVGL